MTRKQEVLSEIKRLERQRDQLDNDIDDAYARLDEMKEEDVA